MAPKCRNRCLPRMRPQPPTVRALAWIIHENIHRIGLVADGGLAGSQSPLWAPKSALRPLQPVYRGGLFSQMRSI